MKGRDYIGKIKLKKNKITIYLLKTYTENSFEIKTRQIFKNKNLKTYKHRREYFIKN